MAFGSSLIQPLLMVFAHAFSISHLGDPVAQPMTLAYDIHLAAHMSPHPRLPSCTLHRLRTGFLPLQKQRLQPLFLAELCS